ncbi:MAG: S9 family peptidase [Planctomycetes bacterium]|nr:S9 family peptidase [Planctomycetota bacterium]
MRVSSLSQAASAALFLSFAVSFSGALLVAQGATGWMRPPDAIARLVEAPPPPDTSLSPQRQWLVSVTREALPSVEVVARPYEKLAGLRIDPEVRGRQLSARTMGITLRSFATGKEHAVAVPPGHWSGPVWSADDRAFVLLRSAPGGAELWVADPATEAPRRVDGLRVSTLFGGALSWLPDQHRLLVLALAPGEAPPRPQTPSGPQVQVTTKGQRAQVRTFQDLLQDAHDEAAFEFFATSQPTIVDPANGSTVKVAAPAMWTRLESSPDGSLLLGERLERPFSFVVPWTSFPRTVEMLDKTGTVVRTVARAPLQESVPIGGVPTGPRSVDWLPMQPHTLAWTEALDGGDPKRDAEARDRVVMLAEPAGEPRTWFTTQHRSAGVSHGANGHTAIATEFDRKTRRQRVWEFDSHDPSRPGRMLYERSTQDAYGDPGRPIGEHRTDGQSVLRMRDGRMFLAGEGASPNGNRPFVDEWVVADGVKRRLFEAAEKRHESFVGFLDDAGGRALVRSESPTESPSLVVVDLATGSRDVLVRFPDPAADFTAKVEKRLLRYEREDGVPLSGTLYLPPGRAADEKLPVLVWAYPLEYAQASDAGQVRASPYRHLRLAGASHLFLLLHGYAVFDDAAMPIVGPVQTANDTFVQQVQMNARAAVKALVAEGCIDEKRIAVAGHSYGAFMTANLLAHTDLFAAGIARSGAYNRTLTPFGFQNEERTYWEAPAVYQAMSPFAHADRIDEPLLLIHGADDDNPGTFPLQSQRLFIAIKGHGGTARLCMLPNEGHGYRARENVLHCLAEMCAWLDTHVKSRR